MITLVCPSSPLADSCKHQLDRLNIEYTHEEAHPQAKLYPTYFIHKHGKIKTTLVGKHEDSAIRSLE